MFNSESELFEKRKENVIATDEKSIWFIKALLLRNEITVIYKRESKNRNIRIKIFWLFLKDMKNRCNIENRYNGIKSRPLAYFYICSK